MVSGELTLKLVWKCKGPKVIKTIFKKNNCGGLTLPEVKTYYKFLTIKKKEKKGKKRKKK